MNRSVVQWLQDLEKRIVELEKRPLPQWPAEVVAEVSKQMLDNAYLSSKPLDIVKVKENLRAMCPKCGEKPNYYFHVKWCDGQKKNNKDADQADRRRDQGPT